MLVKKNPWLLLGKLQPEVSEGRKQGCSFHGDEDEDEDEYDDEVHGFPEAKRIHSPLFLLEQRNQQQQQQHQKHRRFLFDSIQRRCRGSTEMALRIEAFEPWRGAFPRSRYLPILTRTCEQ